VSQQTSKDDGEFERPAVGAGAREHDINATARAMSRENVELVRGYWEVVGDMGAFDPIHPEAEWKPVLTSNAALAGSVTCFSLLVSDPGQSERERSATTPWTAPGACRLLGS